MEEQILLNMVRRLESLEQRMAKVETKMILDESELPAEVLSEAGLLPPEPTVTKRGIGYRPLLLSECKEAIAKTKSMAGAAKAAHVSFKTFKKYCRLYGVWNPTK
jgi:hypothetical protein